MKKLVTAAMTAALFFIIPICVVSLLRDEPLLPEAEPPEESRIVIFTEPEDTSDDLLLKVLSGEDILRMNLHDYVVGVVAAEMPASYAPEALKAQAIAARTNAVYKRLIRRTHPGDASHKNADICTNHAHCQAFADDAAQKEKWGDDYEKYHAIVEDAVTQTDGQIMTYDGNPISAIYHALSSGKTENAGDVWGRAIPYLVSKESVWDKENEKFRSIATLSAENFLEKLIEAEPNAILRGDPASWFEDIERSEAGGIIRMTIGGVSLTGRKFRDIFGLRSANITFDASNDRITMTVLGYGHGVGMSQYGAGAMAKEGKTAEEILTYYYEGVTVESLEPWK